MPFAHIKTLRLIDDDFKPRSEKETSLPGEFVNIKTIKKGEKKKKERRR